MANPPEILVIEDDAFLREALADCLAVAGYGVRTAADGSEGLEAVGVSAPALVVTDIHMPGMDGAAVIATLRQQHPAMPVIAISGLFNAGRGLDAEGAIALGAARALNKPFKGRELLDAVRELLGLHSG